MKLNEFLKLCYEKEIVKKLTIFIVASWTIIQVSHVTHEAIGLPEEFVSTLIILFFLVLPFYIYHTWKKYENEEPYTDLNETEQKERKDFKATFMKGLGLTSLLSVAMIVFVASNKFLRQSIKQSNKDKIAVIDFTNQTGNKELDVIGEMASNWISLGITREKISSVISTEVINGYNQLVKAKQLNLPQTEFLRKYLSPGQIITGSYFQSKNDLIFQASLYDGETDKLLFSFNEETCPSDEPLLCIEKMKQVILSYYINEKGNRILLEDYPPKYEAYKLMLKAKKLRDYSSDEFISLLNDAIEIDPTYFEPLVSRVGYYYNIGNYDQARAKLSEIDIKNIETDRQKNVINIYESLLKGDYKATFISMKEEFDQAPYDFENNNSLMVIALQFVNQPELIPEISAEIDQELINSKDCDICAYRVQLLMDSYLATDQLAKVLSTYREYDQVQNYANIFYPLSTAYIRLGKKDLLEELLLKGQTELNDDQQLLLSLHVYNQSILYDIEVPSDLLTSSIELNVRQAYFNNEFNKVIQLLKANDHDFPTFQVFKAASHHFLNQSAMEQESISRLTELISDNDFGEKEYEMARFYALIGQNDEMYTYLEKAISSGHNFTNTSYLNDPIFKEYKDEGQFQQLLKYWI